MEISADRSYPQASGKRLRQYWLQKRRGYSMDFAKGVDLISRVIAGGPEAQSQKVKDWLESLARVEGRASASADLPFDAELDRAAAGGGMPESRADVGATGAPAAVSVAGLQVSEPIGRAAPQAVTPEVEALQSAGANVAEGGLARGEKQLRAFVMQMMIEEMLPDDVVGLGGKADFASGIWRSMLAEKLALELASAVELDMLGHSLAAQASETSDLNGIERNAVDNRSGT